jgi:uncharacterized protein (DUF4415 family)
LTEKAGQRPSENERARIRAELAEARRHEINLEDIPELPPDALKEFAFLRAAKNRKNRRQTVSVRLTPECIDTYKQLGKGYTSVMADVLTLAAAHPDMLKFQFN